jgi:hypothetical protein
MLMFLLVFLLYAGAIKSAARGRNDRAVVCLLLILALALAFQRQHPSHFPADPPRSRPTPPP